MGCYYSKENGCYAESCCIFVKLTKAAYYIAFIFFFSEIFEVLFNFNMAQIGMKPCDRCIDPMTNYRMCLASIIISIFQWFATIILVLGMRLGRRILVKAWLYWLVVRLAMLVVWCWHSLPLLPNVRGLVALFMLAVGTHFFFVIKSFHDCMPLRPTITVKEESSDDDMYVPPNTPSNKHKRRKQRLDPNRQSAMRTLVGAAEQLQEERGTGREVPNPETDGRKSSEKVEKKKKRSRKGSIRRKRMDLKAKIRAERDEEATKGRQFLEDGDNEDIASEASDKENHENLGFVVVDIEKDGSAVITSVPDESLGRHETIEMAEFQRPEEDVEESRRTEETNAEAPQDREESNRGPLMEKETSSPYSNQGKLENIKEESQESDRISHTGSKPGDGPHTDDTLAPEHEVSVIVPKSSPLPRRMSYKKATNQGNAMV